MRTRTFALIAAAAATVSLPACGGDDPDPVATIAMGEYFFAPAHLTIPQDAKVEIVNQGAELHSWIIREEGVGTNALQPGTRFVLDLSGIAPGRYTVFCDQPNHAQLGQVGTVTISAT